MNAAMVTAICAGVAVIIAAARHVVLEVLGQSRRRAPRGARRPGAVVDLADGDLVQERPEHY
jgi:hypothetical protein